MKSKLQGEVDVVINASPDRVWEALTQPELIKQYFFGTNTRTEWKVGGPIVFSGEYQGKKYEDKGTVLAFEPRSLIRYSHWSPMSGLEDTVENYAQVTYTLKPQGENSTHLEIRQENIPDEKTKDHSLENWKKVLFSLKKMLEDSNQVAAH